MKSRLSNAVVVAALLGALAASTAGAVEPLEAVRSSARALREQVSALRASQLAQRNELSSVSQRIEQLKARQKGALAAGGELDQALKRSQELSGVLSGLAQQVSAREGELESANVTLLEGLTAELTRLRADFDRQTDRVVRRRLIEQMKRLRSEREALRATLPPTRLPQLDTLKPSDDPEELLEQADLLRDGQEKIQKELKALETRIAEKRQEVELDRRVQRFMGEESMLDDQDRRLRVQRSKALEATTTGGPVGGPVGSNSAPAPDTAGPVSGIGAQRDAAPTAGDPFISGGGARSVSGSDGRPQVGSSVRSLRGEDDHLEDLEVERLRLRGMADELKKKADELERRATELR